MSEQVVERECSRCGQWFATVSGRGGRPRTRCEACRSNHDRIAGKRWKAVRAQVLAGNPKCAVATCGNAATTVDHIIPLTKGGNPYDLANLQPMCRACNGAKSRTVDPKHEAPKVQLPSGYWRDSEGRLFAPDGVSPRTREW